MKRYALLLTLASLACARAPVAQTANAPLPVETGELQVGHGGDDTDRRVSARRVTVETAADPVEHA